MKKVITILISTFVLVALLGAGLFYYFFLRTPGTEVQTPEGGSQVLFPTGDTIIPGQAGEITGTVTNDFGSSLPGSEKASLHKIAERDVVSGTVELVALGTTTEKTPVVRYVLRTTGNIFSYDHQTGKTERLSQTTLPGIRNVGWLSNNRQVLQYESDGIVESYSSRISDNALLGAYLPRDLVGIATNKIASSSIFTVRKTATGSSGSMLRTDGTTAREAFSLPLSEILVSWPHQDYALIATKPSGKAEGFLYLTRIGSNLFDKILGPIRGLTAHMNPLRNRVLVSESVSTGFVFYFYDLETRETKTLPLKTLPEKCVWTSRGDEAYCGVPLQIPQGTYPDDWYQGALQFEDRIWKFNVTEGYAEFITELTNKTGGRVDLINPDIAEDGSYMVFTDKNTGALWGLSL